MVDRKKLDRQAILKTLNKLERANRLLTEIQREFEQHLGKRPKRIESLNGFQARTLEKAPSVDDLRRDYENLLSTYADRGPAAVTEFVQNHSSRFLDEFIVANRLPMETQRSKKTTEEELRRQLVQSLMVRGR